MRLSFLASQIARIQSPNDMPSEAVGQSQTLQNGMQKATVPMGEHPAKCHTLTSTFTDEFDDSATET